MNHPTTSSAVGSNADRRTAARPWPRLLLDIAVIGSFVGAWITHDGDATIHSLVSILFTTVALLHARLRQPQWSRRRRLDHLTYVGIIAIAVTGVIDWASSGTTSAGHGAIAVIVTVIVGAHVWKHRRSLRRLVRVAIAGKSGR